MTEPGYQMERKVFKYQLLDEDLRNDYYTVRMPDKATIVMVGQQYHVPTIWAEVDRNSETPGVTNRLFRVYRTGELVSDYDTYRGTYFDGPYVWHIYENNP